MTVQTGFAIYLCVGVFLATMAHKGQVEKQVDWSRQLPPNRQLFIVTLVALFYPLALLYAFYKWVNNDEQ